MNSTFMLVGGAAPIDCGTSMPVYSPEQSGWVAGALVVSDPERHLHVQESSILPSLQPMDFYLAFQLRERMDIKTSKDPVVMEFWDTYSRCERTGKLINPNSPAVQQGLAYLAIPTAEPTPFGSFGPGILKSPERIEQILRGVPQ